MIPLPPPEILKMWQAIKSFDFDTTQGAFVGMDVRDKDLKKRMLESKYAFWDFYLQIGLEAAPKSYLLPPLRSDPTLLMLSIVLLNSVLPPVFRSSDLFFAANTALR